MILRMIFYEGTSLPQIVEDNATVSLENVNEWNHGIWTALPRDERHDVAVWLTRLNIGSAVYISTKEVKCRRSLWLCSCFWRL